MVNQNSVVVKQEPEEQNGNLLQSNENGVNHQESNGNGTANGNGVRQLSQSNGHNGHPALQVKEEGKDAVEPDESIENFSVSKEMGCDYGKESMASHIPRNQCSPLGSRPEFTFESDHEALRGNRDYLSILRTLAVLQAQKVQAVKDLEVLQEAKIKALKDPLAFVERLQAGQDLKLPGRQALAKPHQVDWSKYGLASLSREAAAAVASSYHMRGSSNPKTVKTEETTNGGAKMERNNSGQWLVRGRVFDGKTKPKTFNQPWTAEEQKRLEELLHEFPSEEVEMERWKKIAARLGNRTAIQVQSRIQKYFLKLHKAGLPIPGRLGKQARMAKKTSQSSSSSGLSSFNKGAVSQFINNKQIYSSSLLGQRHSTFFPHLKPDVTMTEDEERDAAGGVDFWALDNDLHHTDDNKPSSTTGHAVASGVNPDNDYDVVDEDVSDEEGVPDELRATPEYQELIWLKRIRREKEWEQRENNLREVVHLGYRCDNCGRDPIVGPRFTCVDCGNASVDLCGDCAPLSPEVGVEAGHTRAHSMRPARKRKNVAVDNEYLVKSSKSAEGNYLDPNYHYFK